MRTEKGVRLLFQKSPAIDCPTAVLTDVAQVTLPYTYFSDVPVQATVSLYDTVRRGTPLSSVVPTLKISTNSPLAKKKPHWIDFDAGVLLDGADMDSLSKELLELCLSVANGKQTKSEEKGFYDIAIFKDGVTL